MTIPITVVIYHHILTQAKEYSTVGYSFIFVKWTPVNHFYCKFLSKIICSYNFTEFWYLQLNPKHRVEQYMGVI
jgi:hypothetical protein